MQYVADDGGYRAEIKTNEPGTHDDNPANVMMYVNEESAPVRQVEMTSKYSSRMTAPVQKIQQVREMSSAYGDSDSGNLESDNLESPEEDVEFQTDEIAQMQGGYAARLEATRKGHVAPNLERQRSGYGKASQRSSMQPVMMIRQQRLEATQPQNMHTYGRSQRLQQVREEPEAVSFVSRQIETLRRQPEPMPEALQQQKEGYGSSKFVAQIQEDTPAPKSEPMRDEYKTSSRQRTSPQQQKMAHYSESSMSSKMSSKSHTSPLLAKISQGPWTEVGASSQRQKSSRSSSMADPKPVQQVRVLPTVTETDEQRFFQRNFGDRTLSSARLRSSNQHSAY